MGEELGERQGTGVAAADDLGATRATRGGCWRAHCPIMHTTMVERIGREVAAGTPALEGCFTPSQQIVTPLLLQHTGSLGLHPKITPAILNSLHTLAPCRTAARRRVLRTLRRSRRYGPPLHMQGST